MLKAIIVERNGVHWAEAGAGGDGRAPATGRAQPGPETGVRVSCCARLLDAQTQLLRLLCLLDPVEAGQGGVEAPGLGLGHAGRAHAALELPQPLGALALPGRGLDARRGRRVLGLLLWSVLVVRVLLGQERFKIESKDDG